MLVGDLVYNSDFDVNCNYEIYDCTEKGKTWYEAELIYWTMIDNVSKPSDEILNMKIKYITTHDGAIIIEATH